ncbi:ileal sodium/bile acid cotransporter-like [Portunus trituberculatus]|uniref:ileal sodium/bile acid cotransporter-like n=1 Tax=Portunus trituberculatus TaxID=210409 RepID=UPI001E1CB79C|nr:ileal sodium/bile acid cotransporter-like [Portunus trituberculatus]
MGMAAVWVVAAAVLCGAGRGAGFHLLVHPSGQWKVPEDTLHNLTVSLSLNTSEAERALQGAAGAVVEVAALHRNSWRLDWQRRVAQFSPEEAAEGVNKTLTFSGYYWGRTHVGLFLTRNDLHLTPEAPPHQDWSSQDAWDDLHAALEDANTTLGDVKPGANLTLLNEIEINVDRSVHVFETVFIALGSCFMLINNINMGAQLDMRIILDVLRRPLGPACGFISQFAFMPLSTFAMGYFFFTDPLYRLGIFTLGCSPGGMMSNFWTLIFGGDINLSITMTAVSTVAAMGMMPMWMFTLGQKLTQGASMQVPYGNLVLSLISLTVPIGLGVALRAWRPKWADRGAKIIKPFTLVVILLFMSFWFYSSYKVFAMMNWQMAVAGFLVAGLGFGLGASLAMVFCLPKAQVIAISIETAFQNGGVVFILLKLSLPSPDSDLAALPAMATMLQVGPPMILLYAVLTILRRYCGCCPVEEEQKAVPADEKHMEAERAREIEAFLSKPDKNIFTDSVMKENEKQYGLVLQGMTKLKLAGDMQETNIV